MQKRERAVIAAVDTGEYDIEASADELRALCDTAGADVVGIIVQRRERPDHTAFLGKGKRIEAKELCEAVEADLLVVDGELSGSRLRNLERAVGIDVVDRTTLILDIFATAAKTAEGKLQVELAQLNYRLPRLSGTGESLSRLGGGIGTRGPGETKLESDRRYIRERITVMKKRLADLEKRREQRQQRRLKAGVPVVALVGYTNVGKSSLLNALAGADTLVEDKLFATLDPTARQLGIEGLQQVVLVDTVGFVSRLPHTLVEAFKSTLEEARFADLLLMVADISSPQWEEQIAVAQAVLAELGAGDVPTLTVYNKCDLVCDRPAGSGIFVSARTGDGLNELMESIAEKLSDRMVRCLVKIPFDKLRLAAAIRQNGDILSEEYEDDGVLLSVHVDRAVFNKVKEYVVWPRKGG